LSRFQLHPDIKIETLLDLSLGEVSQSLSLATDTLTTSETLPELTYLAPQLSSVSSPDGYPKPGVDPEEDQDFLPDHSAKLLIEDNRFFGQAR
jgi:hypothetical protein